MPGTMIIRVLDQGNSEHSLLLTLSLATFIQKLYSDLQGIMQQLNIYNLKLDS